MTLLDKLIALKSTDDRLFQAVVSLAAGGSWAVNVKELEFYVSSKLETPPVAPPLGTEFRENRVLRRLLVEPPLLSNASLPELLTMVEFSDLRPDAERMFQTKDAIFMRLLDLSNQAPAGIPANIEKVLQDDFTQFAILHTCFAGLAAALRKIAESGSWLTDLTAVELALSGKDTGTRSPAIAEVMTAIENSAVTNDGLRAPAFMLAAPRFSAMLPRELLAYSKLHGSLPSPDTFIDKTITPNPSTLERGRCLVPPAIQKLPADDRQAIELGLRVRLECIRDLIHLRAFVKKDVLEHCWPDLYEQFRRKNAQFIQFERQMRSPETWTAQDRQRLEPYLQNEALLQFLSLQPYFDSTPTPALPAVAAPLAAPSQPARPPSAAEGAAGLAPMEAARVEVRRCLRGGSPGEGCCRPVHRGV